MVNNHEQETSRGPRPWSFMNGNAKATNGVTAFASVENNFSSIEQVTGVRAFAFYISPPS